MSAFTGNQSCSVGGSDGGLDEAAAREMLEELVSRNVLVARNQHQPYCRYSQACSSMQRQMRHVSLLLSNFVIVACRRAPSNPPHARRR
jgi:hypothetical protein